MTVNKGRYWQALLQDPADRRTLKAWAAHTGSTSRTLMRHLHKETGQTFLQWRRQLRMLKAVEALALDEPVTKRCA